MSVPEWVTIRGGLSELDAGLLKLRLDRVGIYCTLANQYTKKLSRGQTGGIWLQVPSTEVERAEALLAENSDELSDIDSDLLEEEAEESELCPRCGSVEVEYAAGSRNAIAGHCRDCDNDWTLQ